MARVLLFFVDGVGLGSDDGDVNPFVRAKLPALTDLLGVPAITLSAAPRHCDAASLIPIDAVLGWPGTPQSGTGQATLLTGSNAVEMHGGHFGPWVPARLRTLVREQSILAQAIAAGFRTTFANAYPEEVHQLIGGEPSPLPSDAPAGAGRQRKSRNGQPRRIPSFLRAGPPLAAIGAGLLNRHTPELARGDAVASELTNEGWRERLGRTELPAIDAATAGQNLARIAGQHDLTLFAHYSTDYAGHQQDMEAAVLTLEKLDAFVGGLLAAADDELLICIASDHGNIEDVTTGHTRNPAIGLVTGTGHAAFARRAVSLTDIAPAVMNVLSL